MTSMKQKYFCWHRSRYRNRVGVYAYVGRFRQAAWDNGINFLNTGDFYESGHNEFQKVKQLKEEDMSVYQCEVWRTSSCERFF